MSTKVLDLYRAAVAAGDIEADTNQMALAAELDALRLRLIRNNNRFGSLLRLLLPGAQVPEKGLYIWGGVGSGKTFLMDMFVSSLPFPDKARMHFHRFMQRVHGSLKRHAGRENPLVDVAGEWSKQTRVICFDEFFVQDIADAMLLGELFKQLFKQGVSLVATSNMAPDDLYLNGLQRSRFLLAIDLLKTHTAVHRLETQTDYRLRSLEQTDIYHHPLNAQAEKELHRSLDRLSSGVPKENHPVEVNDRFIISRFATDNALWFDFVELCGGPRSQLDYIELAKCYHFVLIGDIPQMSTDRDDEMRRFISLVDEFYDRNVKLILSAAVPLEELYTGTRLAFAFERTKSRLIEMQSHDFLARPHLG